MRLFTRRKTDEAAVAAITEKLFAAIEAAIFAFDNKLDVEADIDDDGGEYSMEAYKRGLESARGKVREAVREILEVSSRTADR